MANEYTLSIEELADVLQLSPATVRRYAHQCPEKLPPRVNTGSRKLLYLRAAVVKWLEERSGL